ncbi:hypothetical protein J6590_029015, partial [Homalodisca vitripennis]
MNYVVKVIGSIMEEDSFIALQTTGVCKDIIKHQRGELVQYKVSREELILHSDISEDKTSLPEHILSNKTDLGMKFIGENLGKWREMGRTTR